LAQRAGAEFWYAFVNNLRTPSLFADKIFTFTCPGQYLKQFPNKYNGGGQALLTVYEPSNVFGVCTISKQIHLSGVSAHRFSLMASM
jgi:hypothetical protein